MHSTFSNNRSDFGCICQLIGPPDKVKIGKIVAKRKGSGKDATVTVSLEVTDDSQAPARNITYNVKVTPILFHIILNDSLG